MRLFVIIALLGSTYVSWYMMGASIAHGFENAAAAAAKQPTSISDIFQAVSSILFTFGGHAMLMEVLDSQFKYVYKHAPGVSCNLRKEMPSMDGDIACL